MVIPFVVVAAPADDTLRFAAYMYAQGDYYRAAGEYHRWLFDHPTATDPSQALYGLGLSYLRGHRFDQAATFLARATEKSPAPPRAYYALALAQLGLGDRQAARQTLLPLVPAMATPARLQLGRLAAEDGDWTGARVLLRDAGAAELVEEVDRALAFRPYSPTLAGALAIVPGAGRVYLGRPGDVVGDLMMPLVLGGASWYYVQRQNQVMGLVLGLGAVSFWGGGILGTVRDAQRLNERAPQAAIEAITRAADVFFPPLE